MGGLPVSRGSIQVVLLAIMLCALAGAAVIALQPSEPHWVGDSLDLGDLLIGQSVNHPVVVRLARGRDVSQIRNVVSTCGCAVLTGYRAVEHDPSSLALVLRTLPEAYDEGIGTKVLVTYEDGTVDVTVLQGEIVPPVVGWPTSFSYTVEHGRLLIALDERYHDLLVSSEMYWGDDDQLETRFDRATGKIEVTLPEEPPPGDTLDLMLSFGDSQSVVTWVGVTERGPLFSHDAGH